MHSIETIQQYIREIVKKSYGESVRSPDVFRIAHTLGIERRSCWEIESPAPDEPSVARTFSIRRDGPDPSWIIYHDWNVRRERQQFDVAHEIIEQFILDHSDILDDFCHGAGELNDDDFRDLAHQLACYCTRDLLIHPAEFEKDFQACDGDLTALKEKYPSASYEVLAYAMLPHFDGAALLTILDEPRDKPRRIYRRLRANLAPLREPLTAVEEEIVERCFESGRVECASTELCVEEWNYHGPAAVRAFPVFEKHWKRVILFLLASEMQ